MDCGCSFVVEPGAFVDVKIALRLRIADPDKTNEWLINLCYVSWEQINKTLETEGKPGRSGDILNYPTVERKKFDIKKNSIGTI